MRFKLKDGNAPPGPEQIQTITRPFTVCAFQFDINVTGINVIPAAADQESQLTVAVTNLGAQSLFANTYDVKPSFQQNLTDFVRNSCFGGGGGDITNDSIVFPDEIKAGQTGNVSLRFRFPQAGDFTLIETASLHGSEDGPKNNNSTSVQVSVPLPNPLVCEIQPLPGQVDTYTIGGNWFRSFTSPSPPTVTFNNGTHGVVHGVVLSVASPLQMNVRLPGVSCVAGPVSTTVNNGRQHPDCGPGAAWPVIDNRHLGS